MGRSGFVVRFVDVVLILLFGFISISSISETELELPRSTEAPLPPAEVDEVIFVGIRGDGTFLLDDESVEVREPARLRAHLDAAARALGDLPIRVRIRASFDTPMAFLMEVGRICDELGLSRSFEVLMADGGG